MNVIDEPADAVAAGRCVTARSIADGVTSQHPRRCGWCDYPLTDLNRMVDGFNQWADFNNRHGTAARYDVRAFAELPRTRQLELIEAAQGLEPERIAVPDPTPPPPEPSQPDTEVAWLR